MLLIVFRDLAAVALMRLSMVSGLLAGRLPADCFHGVLLACARLRNLEDAAKARTPWSVASLRVNGGLRYVTGGIPEPVYRRLLRIVQRSDATLSAEQRLMMLLAYNARDFTLRDLSGMYQISVSTTWKHIKNTLDDVIVHFADSVNLLGSHECIIAAMLKLDRTLLNDFLADLKLKYPERCGEFERAAVVSF